MGDRFWVPASPAANSDAGAQQMRGHPKLWELPGRSCELGPYTVCSEPPGIINSVCCCFLLLAASCCYSKAITNGPLSWKWSHHHVGGLSRPSFSKRSTFRFGPIQCLATAAAEMICDYFLVHVSNLLSELSSPTRAR